MKRRPKERLPTEIRPGRSTRRWREGAAGPEKDPGSGGWIYGVSPVAEALRGPRGRIEKVLFAEGANRQRLADVLESALRSGVPTEAVPRSAIDGLFDSRVNHQGIVARVASARYADAADLVMEIAGNPRALALIIDGVEDPRNLGAILRVADCAGVDGVFIPSKRAVGLTGTVAKTSAGAIEHLRIAAVTNINRLIDELKTHNIWVIGSDGAAAQSYTDWDWTAPSALVLGSEGKGLHRLTAEKCDQLVSIPMLGKVGSLNVSVAAGVILFEAARQRVSAAA